MGPSSTFAIYRLIILAGLIVSLQQVFAQYPDTYITSRKALIANKMNIETDKKLIRARDLLIKEADLIVKKKKTYSVTNKNLYPPSNTKNDFYSLSRYWWPNPKKATGLPYIQIDGKVNPETKLVSDSEMLNQVSNDVYILGLAYYYTNNDIYAKWIKELIEVFFFHRKTRMNPNLNYSHMIKGRPNSGGATLAALPLVKLIDGIQLIKISRFWKKDDHEMLQLWFSEFLKWMMTNKRSQLQFSARNNLGTYHTVQVATYAMFTNNINLANEVLEKRGKERIDLQIDFEGKLPEELKRATPWEYVKYTLTAFDYLVELANVANVNLYDYQSKSGGSIKKMYEWLVPYANDKKQWKYDNGVTANHVRRILLRSSVSGYSVKAGEKSYSLTYLDILTTDHSRNLR